MLHEPSHLSDQELAVALDGELSSRRSAELRAHLASCPECQARMRQAEAAIADFIQLHRREFDPSLPPIAGPRALLKARLAAIGEHRAPGAVGRFPFRLPRLTYKYSWAAAGLVFLVTLGIGFYELSATHVEAAAAPKPRLTPGATVPLTKNDVCRGSSLPSLPVVPPSLKRQVFEEYGIANSPPDAYEVDYLITPELGGATSIRNLWPQPYYNTTWHAGVKDQLEERLHAMVCNGELDLATAQHDISTNWIAAYKKYFHTQTPLVPRPRARNQERTPVEQELLVDSGASKGRAAGIMVAGGCNAPNAIFVPFQLELSRPLPGSDRAQP